MERKTRREILDLVDENEMEDPRSLGDVEQENLDLKEQMIHMMMTVEQYMAVACVWQAEQEEGYNPYEGNFSDL